MNHGLWGILGDPLLIFSFFLMGESSKEQGSSTRMVALWLGLCLWLSGCVFRGEWLHRMAWTLGLSDVKGGGFLDEFQRGIHQYFFAGETDDYFFLLEVAQIDKKT
jgi:hypothetical protein